MSSIFLFLLATMIWGFGLVATRWTLVTHDPAWSNSFRFLLAGLLAFPLLLWKNKVRPTLSVGVCSLLLLAGLYTQTVGIGHTTLAKSSFFTACYAIFTPLLMRLFFRMKLNRGYWVLLLLAILGMALLCEFKWESFNLGDVFILGSAFLFAMHIVAIDRLAQNEDPILFNLQQCFYIGLMSLPLAFLIAGVPDLQEFLNLNSLFPPGVLAGYIFLAVFSSIGAFSIQVYVQQRIPAHVVSLIFLSESVFGVWFAYLFFHERPSILGLMGGGLVLISVGLVPLLTRFEK